MHHIQKIRTCNLAFLYLFILFWFCNSAVNAQSPAYTNYNSKDGLANSIVHGICQDKNGLMFFGTETGVSRFDGTRFENYTTEQGLPTNEIFGFFCDSRNRVWMKCFKNEVCYYFNGKIYNQHNDTLLKDIRLPSEIRSFFECRNGNIIIECNTVLVVIAKDHIYNYPIPDRQSSYTSLQNISFSRETDSIMHEAIILPASLRSKIQSETLFLIRYTEKKCSAQSNYFLYYSTDSIFYYSNSRQKLYKFSFTDSTMNNACSYVDDSTLAVFNYYRQDFYLLNTNTGVKTSSFLPGYNIHNIYTDDEHNLWASTGGSGVFKFHLPAVNVYTFSKGHDELAVFDIRKIRNSLYVCSDDGYYIINRGKNPKKAKEQIFPSLINHSFIACHSKDITGFNKRLIQSDTPVFNLKSLFVYHDSVLATNHLGTYLFAQNNNLYKRVKVLHRGRSTCAYKQGDTYYTGTLEGLYATKEGGPEVFMGKSNPLFNNRISAFAETPDGILWVGTYEAGLIGLKNGKIITHLTDSSHHICSNIISCIYISNNHLWLGTEKGLNRIDQLNDSSFEAGASYTEKDGLNSNIIHSIFIDCNTVYAGTAKGLCIFDESKMPHHSLCRFIFTGITSSGSALNTLQPAYQLSRNHNNIRFNYSGISLKSGGQIQYQYRLLGLSEKWETTGDNSIFYPSLPPGNYTFQIKAINKFGDASSVFEKALNIQPAFYETNYFKAGFILLMLVAGWLIAKLYINTIKKKEAQKQHVARQIISLEQMALRAQMNPHFIFNCLNSIQHYIIKNDAKGANRYLSSFATLIRRILEQAPKTHIPLSDEMAFLNNYLALEQMQMQHQFEFSIETNNITNTSAILIPNMVIQPYIENAVKHAMGVRGEGNLIKVNFNTDIDKNLLTCTVIDNGKGINFNATNSFKTDQHTGKGMMITNKRIETLNQLYPDQPIKLTIENLSNPLKTTSGTKITIDFKL